MPSSNDSIWLALMQPDAHSTWLKDFPDEMEREACTHKLGNLALLVRARNSSASNKDFAVKKGLYFPNVTLQTIHALEHADPGRPLLSPTPSWLGVTN